MGLDTTHDAWHGAYSAFTRWRHTLAEAAGYTIITPKPGSPEFDAMLGPYVDLDWDAFEPKNFQGEWNTVPGDDPLLYLIAHSDCDGVIRPEQARHLAVRLRELLPKLDDQEAVGHIYPSMRAKTQQFIDGLEQAIEAGEDVEFH